MLLSTVIKAPQGSPPRHGLVDSAFPSPEEVTGSNRWERGFGFTPESCDEPESWIIPCVGTGSTGGPGATNTENRGTDDPIYWSPFVVQSSFKCSAQQRGAINFEERARRIFELGYSKLVETELYRGDAVGFARNAADGAFTEPNLSLVSASATNLAAGASTTPTLAIRSLLQAAATSLGGQRAMLHATPAVAMAWMQSGSVVEERGRLVTRVGGHTVISGTGYTGAGIGNVAPADTNIHWAWITSPIYFLQSPETEIRYSVERDGGDGEAIARRTAIAYWDGCLHAGIPVDSTGTVM